MRLKNYMESAPLPPSKNQFTTVNEKSEAKQLYLSPLTSTAVSATSYLHYVQTFILGTASYTGTANASYL